MLKKIFISFFIANLLSIGWCFSISSNPIKKVNAVDKQKIDVPTELDRNYDELLNNWAKKGKQINCDVKKNESVFCDDKTYIQRLYSLPTKMELAYNDIVKGFIEMYAGRRRGQVSYMLGLGAYYFPLFEEALDREGLPLELKYLPVIESALNPIARSRVGATGLWQFMPATGKMYKLEINSLVDERRDPYKSTQAAVKYLKDMYRIYEDWNLVIAAYNCGPGNVNKAIRRSGGKSNYWDIYPYLPRETRGYVPAFIAATYIMNYHEEHNICPTEASLPTLVDTLGVTKMVHLEQIADVVKIPVDDIRKLNPQYKEDIIPGEYKKYPLKLPIASLSAFIANEDTIYAHRKDELLTHRKVRYAAAQGNIPANGGYATHRVTKGETLGAIAMRYRTSVSQIKKWNNLRSDNLSIGKVLQVSNYVAPQKKKQENVQPQVSKATSSKLVAENGVLKRATKTTKQTSTSYVVKKGDTWGGIAQKTGVSIANIKKWNNIKNNQLIAGKSLKINKLEVVEELVEVLKPEEEFLGVDPVSLVSTMNAYVENIESSEVAMDLSFLGIEEDLEEEDSPDEVVNVVHKVVYGETMSQIASKYGVTVDDILEWNNITDQSNEIKITNLLIVLPKSSNIGREDISDGAV